VRKKTAQCGYINAVVSHNLEQPQAGCTGWQLALLFLTHENSKRHGGYYSGQMAFRVLIRSVAVFGGVKKLISWRAIMNRFFFKTSRASWIWLFFFFATAQAQTETLTNAAIIELTKLGFGDDVIVEKIRHSNHAFDTSLSSLKRLKTAGVSEAIIKAMLNAQSLSANNDTRPAEGERGDLALEAPSYLRAPEPAQYKVYLKDGSILRGAIIKRVPGDYIELQTREGRIFTLGVEEIERIAKLVPKAPSTISPRETFPRETYAYDAREPARTESYSEKSPELAFFLSLIFPGGGQYYNGQIGKGVIMDLMFFGGIGAALTLGIDEYSYYGFTYGSEANAFFWIGLGLASTAEIWSIIDAPISANNINKRRGQARWGHMIELDQRSHVLGLDVTPIKEGFKTSVTLHF